MFTAGDQTQRVDQRVGGLKTVLGVFRQQTRNDGRQRFADIAADFADVRRRAAAVGQQFLHRRAAGIGRAGGQDIKQRATERIQIAAQVRGTGIGRLFGGNVIERSQRHAAGGHIPVRPDRVGAGQTHIDQLDFTIGQNDVRRFDVAVGHPPRRRVSDRGGQFDGVVYGVVDIHRPVASHQIPQVRALDELEHDVIPTVILADLEHPRDSGVIQFGGRLGFVDEPSLQIGIIGDVRNHLQRHPAVEPLIVGAKDGTHTAAADQFLNLEVVEVMPDQHRRDRGGRRIARPRRRF